MNSDEEMTKAEVLATAEVMLSQRHPLLNSLSELSVNGPSRLPDHYAVRITAGAYDWNGELQLNSRHPHVTQQLESFFIEFEHSLAKHIKGIVR